MITFPIRGTAEREKEEEKEKEIEETDTMSVLRQTGKTDQSLQKMQTNHQ